MWILKILAGNLAIVFITELLPGFALGARTLRKLITVALVNIITNPAVVLSAMCLTLFFERWQHVGIIALELIAVLAEGFMFSKFEVFGKKNPYLISFMLAVSFLLGEIINIFL